MGLIVSLHVLLADVVLFLVVTYSAFYALTRVHRYGEPLNRFIVIIAISLLLAALGRLIDVVDDVVRIPFWLFHFMEILYFLAIIGVAYGVISYISSVERRILPTPPEDTGSEAISPGGYLYEDGDDVLEFLSMVDGPVLVMTRSPWRYEGLDKVRTIWVTPVGEKGISPTRLHVLLEAAVEFMKGGGKLIVVDCLEVLVLYNDFSSVFRFLSSMKDYALSSGSAVLLLIEEGAMEKKELNILKREFRPIKRLEEILRTFS